MWKRKLEAQNAALTALLEQAGLDAQASIVAARIQAVLTDEIHHRMKNMLAMVTALVRQSMRSATSLAEAEAAISVRLIAMSNAHELLLKADLKTASLLAVVQGAIGQHNTAAGRIDVAGTDHQIVPSSILPLALTLNELCTNATKYGALSSDRGRVALTWKRDVTSKYLVFTWIESGGPPVAAPAQRSFGTRLIEDALPRQLDGTAKLIFAPAGAIYELCIPWRALQPVELNHDGHTEHVTGLRERDRRGA